MSLRSIEGQQTDLPLNLISTRERSVTRIDRPGVQDRRLKLNLAATFVNEKSKNHISRYIGILPSVQ